MNGGNAFSTYWAPVINLAREPRWGRNIETPGEDPYLSGEYASAFVGGFERSEDDPTHLQASACCKHYVANSMEDSTVAGEHHARYEFNANISMRDLVDSYLLPFQVSPRRVAPPRRCHVAMSMRARRPHTAGHLPTPRLHTAGVRREGQGLVADVLVQRRERRPIVRQRLAAQHGRARGVGLRRCAAAAGYPSHSYSQECLHGAFTCYCRHCTQGTSPPTATPTPTCITRTTTRARPRRPSRRFSMPAPMSTARHSSVSMHRRAPANSRAE